MNHIPSWYDYIYQDYGYETHSDNYMTRAAFVKYYTSDTPMSECFLREVRPIIIENRALIPPIESMLDYYMNLFGIKDDYANIDEIGRFFKKWAAIMTEERTIAEMISIAGAVAGFINSAHSIKTQSVHLEEERALNEELTDYVIIHGDKIYDQGIRGKDEEALYEYLNSNNPEICRQYAWYGKEEREKALAEAISDDENADFENPKVVREILSKIMLFEDEE